MASEQLQPPRWHTVEFTNDTINTVLVNFNEYQFIELVLLKEDGKVERLVVPVGNQLIQGTGKPYYATGFSQIVIGINDKASSIKAREGIYDPRSLNYYRWNLPSQVPKDREVIIEGPFGPKDGNQNLTFNYVGKDEGGGDSESEGSIAATLFATKIAFSDVETIVPPVLKKLGYDSLESFHAARVYPDE